MGAARRAHHAEQKALRVIGSQRAQESAMARQGKEIIERAKKEFYQPELSYLDTLLGDTDFGIRRAQAPKSPALGLKISLGGKVTPDLPEGVTVLQPGEFPTPKGPEGPSYEESVAKLAGNLEKPDEAYLKSIKEAHYKNIAKLSGLEYEPFTPSTPVISEDQYKKFTETMNLGYDPGPSPVTEYLGNVTAAEQKIMKEEYLNQNINYQNYLFNN